MAAVRLLIFGRRCCGADTAARAANLYFRNVCRRPNGGWLNRVEGGRFKNDWQASVCARGGFAFDRWLVYATGGVAWADIRAEAIHVPGLVGGVTASSAFETDSKRRWAARSAAA